MMILITAACGSPGVSQGNSAPIQLQLSQQKHSYVVGEGVRIDIEEHVRAGQELESVELNRDRTEIQLTHTLGDSTTSRELTGRDYIELHDIHPLTAIGTTFRVPAESTWVSELNLCDYSLPLSAGNYDLSLSYRYGDSAQDRVSAGEISFEVVPAELQSADWRWFGGSSARSHLEALWSATAAGRVHWIYQASEPYDPAVVRFATDLDMPPEQAAGQPQFAFLNDLAALHAYRYAVWLTDSGTLAWFTFDGHGRKGEPRTVTHGLDVAQPIILAEPPFQLQDDGLAVACVGVDTTGNPAVTLIEIHGDSVSRRREVGLGSPLPTSAVMAWRGEATQATGTLYTVQLSAEGRNGRVAWLDLETGDSGEVYRASADTILLRTVQWGADRHIIAGVRNDTRVSYLSWNDAAGGRKPDTVWQLTLTGDDARLRGPFDVAVTEDLTTAGFLFRDDMAWTVITPHSRIRLPREAHPSEVPPNLIAAAGGSFHLVYHDPGRGFLTLTD